MDGDRGVVGTMVACLGCKTIVWAYSGDYRQLRGICNMLRLACPQCGAVANFDGWSLPEETLANMMELDAVGVEQGNKRSRKVYDVWSALRLVAHDEKLTWNPSPDNIWRAPTAEERVLNRTREEKARR